MNKLLVIEVSLTLMAIVGLGVMLVVFARDQTMTLDVFLAGSYSLMFSTGSYVMRKNREERNRKEFLAKHPHLRSLYERTAD